MEKRPVLLKVEMPFWYKPANYLAGNYIQEWTTQQMHDYVQALIREMLANASEFSDCEVVAIRLGGGTASHAGPSLAELMHYLRESFNVAENATVTMATSTNNISGANFPLFRRAGVTRYDLLQMVLFQPLFIKLNPHERYESFEIACDSFIHSYNNDKLGICLLYGHEEISTQNFRRSCLAAAHSHASHISFIEAVGPNKATDELTAQHKAQIVEILGEEGFSEYVPNQWAREGKEDPYFAGHEQGAEELGFGLGAQTRIEGMLSTNTCDFETYVAHSADYTKITASTEPL